MKKPFRTIHYAPLLCYDARTLRTLSHPILAMRHILALFLLASFTLAACSDADTEAPVISDLVITPTPGVGIVCGEEDPLVISVLSGDSLTISMTVTDDELLSQYKIDIHQNFDCHGHSRLATTDWEVIDIVDITGTSATIQRTVHVSDSATAGTYHFSILLADFFGNSASTEHFSINVLNRDDTVPPVLTVTLPSTSDLTVSLTDTIPNDSIIFAGNVSDNLDLGTGGNGRVELRFWRDSSANVFMLYNESFFEGLGSALDFDFVATVPPTLAAGGYIFELRAFDGVNNPAVPVIFNVTVE
ncbi:MAG: DUF4625 domain-containing protein [Flavobacteriales bacterium]|nr:DUF4625 domain-containing protein [Flavobacteriales bacterium]